MQPRRMENAMMNDTTIKKVRSDYSPVGNMGQVYLASGKRLSMRLWAGVPATGKKPVGQNDYETVGYVLAGKAILELDGQAVILEPGDSWLVPAGAIHRYRIVEDFSAVEATAPPAQVHCRDE